MTPLTGPAKPSLIAELMAAPMRHGQLVWIGLRPERRAPIIEQADANLVAEKGIAGDRYRTTSNGARQVTLIAQEDIAAIAAFLGLGSIAPALLRRNLVTARLNLAALKGRRFRIGSAVLETSGECAPCSRMEEIFSPGGYNAVRGRGGITARILEGGHISVGDDIHVMPVA
jgi:MOSC domain-containing protein YiiM